MSLLKPCRFISILLTCLLLQSCIMSKSRDVKQRHVASAFEQIGIKDLITRYLQKDHASTATAEGIYSVSIVIIKKSKGFLSSVEKEKTVERKENYSKVAILRDQGNTNREYMEISMNNEHQASFPVIGEFSTASDGNLLIYKHLEAKGKSTSYTFTYDVDSDLLEGVRTENKGSVTFTYKLTYLKLFPKNTEHAKL
jgi:hypothetical protein